MVRVKRVGVERSSKRGGYYSRTVSSKARALGGEAFKEYWKLRDRYKLDGLGNVEAVERASKELRIEERYREHMAREALGASVPLTVPEVQELLPSYVPVSEPKQVEVGDEDLSFVEEVLWARDQRARVQNGGESPTRFPSAGALSWYQFSLQNSEKFMSYVASASKPRSDEENAYLTDGKYRMRDLEQQLRMVLVECGNKFRELERDFLESLDGEVASCE